MHFYKFGARVWYSIAYWSAILEDQNCHRSGKPGKIREIEIGLRKPGKDRGKV